MKPILQLPWLTAVCFYACGMQSGNHLPSRYFSSPQQSVERINQLLHDRAWNELGLYYDLTGSNLSREKLQSAGFFIRTERPANDDPAGFWRYRHPFPPGFVYLSDQPAKTPELITVVVCREIDQGVGPMQKAVAEYQLRVSPRGYQLLPP